MENKVKVSKEEKKQIAIANLKTVYINTLSGKTTMFNLCVTVGVKQRKSYFDIVESKRKKGEAVLQVRSPVKETYDFGFVFKDGFEIRGVDKSVWKLFDEVENIEVKKRIR